MTTRRRMVIVGHGMVGHKLIDAMIRRGATRTWDIVVIGEEPQGGYDRVHLSSLFDGATPDDLALEGVDVRSDPAVTVVAGEQVRGIDRAARAIHTDGGVYAYDVAVLATGSVPFVPPVPGRDLPGCFVYRTIDDVDAIRAWASGRQHGVVVGGGLLGLEAAGALRSCGLATEIVEFAPRLMPAQVDDGGGVVLRRRIEAMGLMVHTSTAVAEVLAGVDGVVEAVTLKGAEDPDEGGLLATEMVVFAAGIRPRDDLARSAGLEVGPRGGIIVDRNCRTSDPSLFAIGECALADGRIHGLVSPGYQMARAVAETVCGGDASFSGGETPTKLKLLGVEVASFGDAHARARGAATITFSDDVALVHKRLVVDDTGRVTGGILVGDASSFDALVSVAAGDRPSPSDPAELLVASGPSEPSTSAGVSALPPTAQICSCENVSKGAICEVIDGCVATDTTADVAAVKSATAAGTGCGGCIPQLAELVRRQLAAAGMATTDHLCAHFSHSRRELFAIVRAEGITTFADLVRAHGQGRGCEVCKPAVASILASQRGGHILDGEGAALQDTNDHFLANLQRDGTYSVVPRVPGGEITAEKLIVLGQVAQDFNLYVKITGGQRIDLLGARVEALPAIWARLVDAGFESGHAYGKALRTVKSCVGTNWCRYGVQDSTSLAIDLENRYRGLRSPHKIKMAVSGCARECAEAQSKDVGVIATERGWNVYVGGNGGTRPRHAELLASDLDTDTLVHTIDRFIMLYIRSADRLQRTATWVESLDGGIDHLRTVVLDDALGVAAELDADMARHVEDYRCEWAETLSDPARLRRFRSFVNSDEPDPDVVVVQERSQPRPAHDWERVTLLATRR
ncbi:MAG: nitrite reductase large subunit NirB [Actinomycetota bacterium]|nr:nitrite reductase large subunit NirB [Actinomycetota bacterium]